jgi:hypothetical protein|tara:strand:+ start:274 stop:405 length:132 start_codon:yes stop_codon:yes gene_type:complete
VEVSVGGVKFLFKAFNLGGKKTLLDGGSDVFGQEILVTLNVTS